MKLDQAIYFYDESENRRINGNVIAVTVADSGVIGIERLLTSRF